MTAVDHLIAALVELEREMMEIEHRQSFVRSAIEAFGIDADDALLVAMREEEGGLAVSEWVYVERPAIPAEELNAQFAVVDLAPTPEVVVQERPHHFKTSNGSWNWQLIADEIEDADAEGKQRAKHLVDVLDIGVSTAYHLIKRCREMSLIDVERAPVNHQAARDAAAAAL